MEAKDVRTLMEAYASVYEGYGKKKKGDCVSKSDKGDHNCAKKVCHEQYGEGETIFGQHAVPDENGFVSHYNVQFEHGIVENVSVEDMDILTMEAHGEHVEHEGETISEMGMKPGAGEDQRVKSRMPSASKKPAPSTRAPKKPSPAPRADRKPAPSTRAPKKPSPAPRADRKPAPKGGPTPPMTEEKIDEGIIGALKKVGKAVLGPADQSPEAEAARMGKRRPKGAGGSPKVKVGLPTKKSDAPGTAGGSGGTVKEDSDVFDIVKGYLMTEHDATEEEALLLMLELTDEERNEIIEGSCMGGKDRKRKKK